MNEYWSSFHTFFIRSWVTVVIIHVIFIIFNTSIPYETYHLIPEVNGRYLHKILICVFVLFVVDRHLLSYVQKSANRFQNRFLINYIGCKFTWIDLICCIWNKVNTITLKMLTVVEIYYVDFFPRAWNVTWVYLRL